MLDRPSAEVVKVWLSTEISWSHRREKAGGTRWRHDRIEVMKPCRHVVAPDFDRANDAFLGATSDAERLVVYPAQLEIAGTANRRGGRPLQTKMAADRAVRLKRSAAPIHGSSFISGDRTDPARSLPRLLDENPDPATRSHLSL